MGCLQLCANTLHRFFLTGLVCLWRLGSRSGGAIRAHKVHDWSAGEARPTEREMTAQKGCGKLVFGVSMDQGHARLLLEQGGGKVSQEIRY